MELAREWEQSIEKMAGGILNMNEAYKVDYEWRTIEVDGIKFHLNPNYMSLFKAASAGKTMSKSWKYHLCRVH